MFSKNPINVSNESNKYLTKMFQFLGWVGWRIVAMTMVIPLCVSLIVNSNIVLKKKKILGSFGVEQAYLHANDNSIPWISLGFREFAADILWLRTIIYFGGHLRRAQNTKTIAHLLNSTINADPWFEAPYRFGSAMMMVNGVRQTNEDTLTAIDVLKRAAARYPKEYHYPLKVGSYYLSEMKGTQEEEAAWHVEASEWINKAALLGDDVPWLPSLAANLLDKAGQRELAIEKLKEAYLITDDPEKKRQIRLTIGKLLNERLADQLDAIHRKTVARKKDSPLKYLDDDAFIMIHEW